MKKATPAQFHKLGIFALRSADAAVSPYNLAPAVRKSFSIPKKITVYDTTLRDGEQTPGVSFSESQKIEIARQLDAIGVPQIEAGFPAVSKAEFGAVRAVVRQNLGAEILALSRLSREDIDAAAQCGVGMVLLFIGTSDLHIRFKLREGERELLGRVADAVSYAESAGLKVSFSAEDSMRTRLPLLRRVFKAAEAAGACRIGITDTVGCASPEAVRHIVKFARQCVKKPVSIHLHNDFGLALANAIAGVQAGAQAVSTTVMGIGERAGNVPLEQFVAAMKWLYGRDLGIDPAGLKTLSETVARHSRIRPERHRPLVGQNVFSHESGIHVSAVLSCPFTYEPISPAAVGNRRRLILGKHSGSGIIRSKLAEKGVEASPQEIGRILARVKERGEKSGRVSSSAFWEIARSEMDA